MTVKTDAKSTIASICITVIIILSNFAGKNPLHPLKVQAL